jgi:hypothetical protein
MKRTNKISAKHMGIVIVVTCVELDSIEQCHSYFALRDCASISQQESIRVCCAWDDKLADGILTYKKIGDGSSYTGTSEYKQAVYSPINEWNSKLHGIKLVEVSSDKMGGKNNNNDGIPPDLKIKLSSKTPRTRVGEIFSGDISSGSKTRLSTQGVSYIKRDSNGFITDVLITIFTSDPFGNTLLSSSSFDPGKIQAITKHEIGHALSIGHSNLISDLMYPVINSRTNTISDCDIHAVSEADSWKFESNDNNSGPQPPSVSSVLLI